MEENLFLNSLECYTDMAAKLESGVRGSLRNRQSEDSMMVKTGFSPYPTDLSDSSLNIIVKNEPEEDSWDPDLTPDPDLLPDGSSQSQQQSERERQRNIRFSDEENDVLIKSVMPHYEKLFGQLAARHSTVAKNAVWREIASAVNVVSACPRSVQNCKKRFADIKRKVKEKLNRIDKHRRMTGSSARLHVSFWPYESVMEKIIATDIVAEVPGTTDSGRLTEQDDGEDDENGDGEDFPGQSEDRETVCSEVEEAGHATSEESSRENRPELGPASLKMEQVDGRRQQTMRDHTTLIYAEQSLFRRTMAQKLNILNSNMKALNKNVKACQRSFSEGMVSLSQAMHQQNAILEKLSTNLLMMAEQQQQHNKQCMSGMQQVIHHLDLHQVSLSPTPSDSASDGSPLPMDARLGPHWRKVRRRGKSQISTEHTPKKRRH
ncbi:uncharacterized protein PAF06_007298 [Gastrophryne carolinensis]